MWNTLRTVGAGGEGDDAIRLLGIMLGYRCRVNMNVEGKLAIIWPKSQLVGLNNNSNEIWIGVKNIDKSVPVYISIDGEIYSSRELVSVGDDVVAIKIIVQNILKIKGRGEAKIYQNADDPVFLKF